MDGFEIHGPSDPLGDADMRRVRELIGEAFAPVEGPTEGEYATFNVDPRFHLYVHRGDDGVIDAFAELADLVDEAVLINYFCVDARKRGHGLGGRMLERFKLDAGNRLLVGELDPPETDDICRRRADFYLRHGMCINDGYYAIPGLEADDPEVRLLLMTYPVPVEGEKFEHLKDLVHEVVLIGY